MPISEFRNLRSGQQLPCARTHEGATTTTAHHGVGPIHDHCLKESMRISAAASNWKIGFIATEISMRPGSDPIQTKFASSPEARLFHRNQKSREDYGEKLATESRCQTQPLVVIELVNYKLSRFAKPRPNTRLNLKLSY
jgi:hypothetical protein